MRDRHGRTEQVAAGPDRLAYRLAPMEHHLEVQVRDSRAGRTEVIARMVQLDIGEIAGVPGDVGDQEAGGLRG